MNIELDPRANVTGLDTATAAAEAFRQLRAAGLTGDGDALATAMAAVLAIPEALQVDYTTPDGSARTWVSRPGHVAQCKDKDTFGHALGWTEYLHRRRRDGLGVDKMRPDAYKRLIEFERTAYKQAATLGDTLERALSAELAPLLHAIAEAWANVPAPDAPAPKPRRKPVAGEVGQVMAAVRQVYEKWGKVTKKRVSAETGIPQSKLSRDADLVSAYMAAVNELPTLTPLGPDGDTAEDHARRKRRK